MTDQDKTKRILSITKLVLLVLLIVVPAILCIVYKDELHISNLKEWLPVFLNEHRTYAILILILLQFVQVVICFLPGEPIQIVSSYFYGIGGGLLIALVGAFFGAIVAFLIARKLGNDAIHVLFGREKVAYYKELLNSSKAYAICLIIYLMPGIPKDLVAYVAGVSDMKLKPFVILSTIGRIPGVVGSLLIGYFLNRKNYIMIGITFVVGLIIIFICIKNREKLYALMDKLSGDNEAE